MNKKGFTLVELLGVIAILAITLIIAIPKLADSLSSSKEKLYNSTVKEIEKTASQYVASHPELLEDTSFIISLETLCEDKYLDCPVIDTRNNSELEGYVLVSFNNNRYTYSYINSNTIEYILTIILNGGSTTQIFENTYPVGEEITLINPTRTGYIFTGWTIDSGTINDNVLTMGNSNITITANWTKSLYNLTVDLDGGSTTQTFSSTIIPGAKLPLINPTRTGYTFTGWSVTGGTINNNVLTMGNSNITITANWELVVVDSYEIQYELNGGEVLTQNPTSYDSNSNNITLNNPTKDGYTFVGWTGSNGETPQTTIVIPNGSTGDKSYTANWQITVTPFNYSTDGVQTFTPTFPGTYKLEVWGAEGGSYLSHGGLAGYSVGTIELDESDSLYIYVGGQGSITTAGINGGGTGTTNGGGGGGATHIATYDRGSLNNYSLYKTEILIVAGGGGGSTSFYTYKACQIANGGAGGGNTGGIAEKDTCGNSTSITASTGGQQLVGGTGASMNQGVGSTGTFGQGGDGTTAYDGAGGGGGGYYGGAGGSVGGSNNASGGGGGSGYIGGVTSAYDITPTTIAGNEEMPNPEGGTMVGRSGDGYARITYLGPQV